LEDHGPSISGHASSLPFIDVPSRRVEPAMVATLVCGMHARSVAKALACRIAWTREDLDADDAFVAPSDQRVSPLASYPAGWPTLEWSRSLWIVDAIDGWERWVLPWWLDGDPQGNAGGTAQEPSILFSKLCLVQKRSATDIAPNTRERMWVRARWPATLRQRRAKTDPMSQASMSAETAPIQPDQQRDARLLHMPVGQSDLLETPWFHRAADILRRGIDLHIDGMWT
ncbi:MAG: hypothetical protein ACKO3W_09020, partial [bacterium]